MFECFTSFMLVEHLRDAALDPPIGPAGYPRQLDPTRQPFPTRDGYLAIVPYTPDSTARLMALLGSDGLTATPDFPAAQAQGQPLPSAYTDIARKPPTEPTADKLELFAQRDITAIPRRPLHPPTDRSHRAAIGLFQTPPQPPAH